MSIALYLTLARILMSPIFLVVYLYHESFGISLIVLPYVLIVLLGLSELSDLFDGFLARKKNQVTDLGKILDPMADSIFRLSVFLTFTQGLIKLPLLLVFVFLYRDTIISTLRTVCALRGVALAARLSGKIKAVIQAITAFFILILMIPYSLGYIDLEYLRIISLYSVVVAAAYTIYSGVEYIYANRNYLRKALDRL
ncbi:MAG TPA: CDP-diacylglycerol--glycerol-3-phosphate 3-phosphatidyltransferase [Rhabdochlamydiaceae bacterium]|nr:CDP-diacylglycerol--glycerol-3-phosphate 3-phosphatidyltransferase [Rhabdochlamydiaceae bacterium]